MRITGKYVGKERTVTAMRKNKHRTQTIQTVHNFFESLETKMKQTATDSAVSTTETAGHCATKESVHYKHWELYVWRKKIVKVRKQ